jgi:hypothetical protein
MLLYTKFLGKKDEAVLAYLGGSVAYGKDRRVRVDAPRPSLGFHRFEIEGRTARAIAPGTPALEALPRVRGHYVRGWLVGSEIERVRLVPEEEPAVLTIVRTRRWHSGDLVFEALDFETEVEEEARARLEKLEPLDALKGVPSTLRFAFAIAFLVAIGARLEVPLSVREAASLLRKSPTIDEALATRLVRELAARRQHAHDEARIFSAPVIARPVSPRDVPTLDNAPGRAEIALDVANARMLSSRGLGGGNLEVTFELMGERFISVVDAITFHVYDAGVCLAGADELVTLDSLPGVIREAIDEGALVITRR